MTGKPKKIFSSHTAAQMFSVLCANIQIMGIIYHRHNIRQQKRNRLPAADNVDTGRLLWKMFLGIIQDLKEPSLRKRLGNIIKGMKRKGIRHKITGESEENQKTGVIDFPQLSGRVNAINPFHKNIHKNNLINARLKCVQKLSSSQKAGKLCRFAGSGFKILAENFHLFYATLLIIYDGNFHENHVLFCFILS